MHTTSASQIAQPSAGSRRVLSILLWIAVSAGWLVSTFSVIQEMCMVSACRDTAAYTVFGFNMGWFGIAYFSLVMTVLWLRTKDRLLDSVFSVLVFSGIGAELRLLWIQKYVIGGWCPLCITICCALFFAAMLLIIERVRSGGAWQGGGKGFLGWLAFQVTVIAAGLSIALVGVKELI